MIDNHIIFTVWPMHAPRSILFLLLTIIIYNGSNDGIRVDLHTFKWLTMETQPCLEGLINLINIIFYECNIDGGDIG